MTHNVVSPPDHGGVDLDSVVRTEPGLRFDLGVSVEDIEPRVGHTMAIDHVARGTAGAGSGRRAVGAATRPSPPLDRRTLRSEPVLTSTAVTVAVVTSQGVVTAGIAAVLAGVADITVRGVSGASAPTRGADIVIYDVNRLAHGSTELARLVRTPGLPVLALTFEPDSELGRCALTFGVNGLLPPGLPARQIQTLVLDTAHRVGLPGRRARPTR